MLTITGAAQPRRKGSWWRRKASTPSLSRPIELRSPAEVSIVRQGTLPARGSGVIVLGTIPPSRCRSTKSTISLAYPKVPDATRIGFGRRRRPSWTDRSIDPPSGGLAAGTFVMGCGRGTGQAGTGRNAGTGRGMRLRIVAATARRRPASGEEKKVRVESSLPVVTVDHPHTVGKRRPAPTHRDVDISACQS